MAELGRKTSAGWWWPWETGVHQGTEKINRNIRIMAARFSLAEKVSYKYRRPGLLVPQVWGTSKGKPWPLRTQVKHT